MQTRRIATQHVSSIGLGCMNLSHAYGVPPSAAQAESVLLGALDVGITLLDTAALYGFGANEELLGKVLSGQRHRYMLASKCGIFQENGRRVIDGRPATIKKTCEDSLRRLRTDVIDLYYLHRWDKQVPIEDSVGALSELVTAGKIRAIGLSEVSATTLRKAHAVHPIAALQTEYSLWTRNPEIAVLDVCRELDIAFVAFSPLGRGFLSESLPDVSHFEEKDIRRSMPRFSAENMTANLGLHRYLTQLATQAGCTIPQLALAWLLAKGEHIIALPGTTSFSHLKENIGAADCVLSAEVVTALDKLMHTHPVNGRRYNAATQTEIDTEEFS
ncbi:aldo/keto reductase [Undibacterium sp. RuRC25W]|uniref:aldo/keto reductase n=1 Tax=Undibacterium sp. RuRC25W TaxID=3413047 RepID=UPI003BEF6D12